MKEDREVEQLAINRSSPTPSGGEEASGEDANPSLSASYAAALGRGPVSVASSGGGEPIIEYIRWGSTR